jgi:uncharacterized protein YbaP (TraB family)
MYFEVPNSNVRLGGTMHLLPAGQPLPDWLNPAYSWSKHLYLEHDLADAARYVHLPSGQSMEQRLPSELWAQLKTAWPANLAPLTTQRPWAIGAIIALAGVPLELGVEPTLTARAQADSRSLRYLESLSEFSGLIDQVPDSSWADALGLLLRNRDMPAQRLKVLYPAWIAGDVEAVYGQMPMFSQFPEIQRAIFELRNKLWLPRILGLLPAHEPTLILVGAGHLGGPSGLLALLKGAGRTVQPMP